MRYKLEHRIETLAHNAVMADGRLEAAFSVAEVRYSHWDFDHSRGWLSDWWLAEAWVEADDFRTAFSTLFKQLNRVVPRVALIAQTYADFRDQPYLIVREAEQVGYLRYIQKTKRVGLMFLEDHREALDRLLIAASIPEEFFYYWNDVVNAVGYTPKLLLMCSAVECLTRVTHGKKDWVKVEQILGKDLKEELFGVQGDSAGGLRHRLVHGEYFGPDDFTKNYVDVIHRRVIAYFNEQILNEPLLALDITSPQRHPVGGLEGGAWFIKAKTPSSLSLKSVLDDFAENDVNNLKHHALVFPPPPTY